MSDRLSAQPTNPGGLEPVSDTTGSNVIVAPNTGGGVPQRAAVPQIGTSPSQDSLRQFERGGVPQKRSVSVPALTEQLPIEGAKETIVQTITVQAPVVRSTPPAPVSSGSGSGVLLQTNGVAVPVQNKLNVVAGTGVTVSPDSAGGLTVASTVVAPTLKTNGSSNSTQTALNLKNGTGITLTAGTGGDVTVGSTVVAPSLKTNGSNNGSQTILNLTSGSNVTITDGGSGDITIASTGGGGGGSSTLATLTDVTVSSPTDTQVLTYDNASSKWMNKAAPSGSGGTSVYSTASGIDLPLATPDPLDDEFNGTGLNAKWTPTSTNTAIYDVNSTYPDCLHIYCNGNQTGTFSQAFSPGSADFTLCAKISQRLTAAYEGSYIFVTDNPLGDNGTVTNCIRAGVEWAGGAGWKLGISYQVSGTWTYWSFSTTITSSGTDGMGTLYFLLQRTGGNTYTFWYSQDGKTWAQVTGSYTSSMSVQGCYIRSAMSGSTNQRHFVWEFFRRNWIGVLPADATQKKNVSSIAAAPTTAVFTSPYDIAPAGSAYDDEFKTGALNSAWTVNKNTVTQVDYGSLFPSCLYLRYGANTGYVISKAFAPAGDCSMTAKIGATPVANYNTAHIGLGQQAGDGFGTGGNANGHEFIFGYSGSNPVIRCDKWVSGSRTLGSEVNAAGHSLVYLHIQRVSGTWSVWYSYDGWGWYKYTGWTPSSPTVNYAVFVADQYGSTTDSRVLLDFIRFNWLFL